MTDNNFKHIKIVPESLDHARSFTCCECHRVLPVHDLRLNVTHRVIPAYGYAMCYDCINKAAISTLVHCEAGYLTTEFRLHSTHREGYYLSAGANIEGQGLQIFLAPEQVISKPCRTTRTNTIINFTFHNKKFSGIMKGDVNNLVKVRCLKQ